MVKLKKDTKNVIFPLLGIDANWGTCDDISYVPLRVPAKCMEILQAFVEDHQEDNCTSCEEKPDCDKDINTFIPDLFNDLLKRGITFTILEAQAPGGLNKLLARTAIATLRKAERRESDASRDPVHGPGEEV